MQNEYTVRINRVIDYIDSHLGEDLPLGGLARVASFSPYHFHRLFRAFTGEPLYRFIQRLRLEKAATHLVEKPWATVTEVALDCGFSSSSSFARAFKEYFGRSATDYRSAVSEGKSKMGEIKSKAGKTESKERQDAVLSGGYAESINLLMKGRNKMLDQKSYTVEVKTVEGMNVAYVRHTGPYKGDENLFADLFNRLCTWAGPRDLLADPDLKMLAVYHDNPDVTEEKNLRVSVCMTVPESTEVSGEVGNMVIPGGKYAIGHFEIDADRYEEAWNALYGGWLPSSGYQPDDRPPFELYRNDPKDYPEGHKHPEGKHIVDIYLPVKPL